MSVKTNNIPKHLYDLTELNSQQVQLLLDSAKQYLNMDRQYKMPPQVLSGHTICTAFFENSTRTRLSFELAALKLGATTLNFSTQDSSLSKGETTLDTLKTLAAMGCDTLILRTRDETLFQTAVATLPANITLLNAGSGCTSHPTQGLLDCFTISQHKPNLTNLKVVIVGDIKHSRVARSDIIALQHLGVRNICVVAPPQFMPADNEMPGVDRQPDFSAALDNADVVIMLRIQHERLSNIEIDTADYHAQFGLTEQKLALAKPDALVLHPGPLNRNVEISDAVADGAQSVILEQVRNGVAMRMALLTHFAKR